MSNPLQRKSWSPYLVGVGIGVLSWFAFWSANHPLGITTAFEHTAALAIEAAAPGVSETNNYFQEQSPKIGWEWMLVVGVLIGSIISSMTSEDHEPITVPPLWKQWIGGLALVAAAAVAYSLRGTSGASHRVPNNTPQRQSPA